MKKKILGITLFLLLCYGAFLTPNYIFNAWIAHSLVFLVGLLHTWIFDTFETFKEILGSITMFFYKIHFRLKYKFPYKDTCMLDRAFIDWVYPRITYFITEQIKIKEEYEVKDYNEMLDLIEDLKENYTSVEEKSVKKYKRFCSLFRKHSDGLWIDF